MHMRQNRYCKNVLCNIKLWRQHTQPMAINTEIIRICPQSMLQRQNPKMDWLLQRKAKFFRQEKIKNKTSLHSFH